MNHPGARAKRKRPAPANRERAALDGRQRVSPKSGWNKPKAGGPRHE